MSSSFGSERDGKIFTSLRGRFFFGICKNDESDLYMTSGLGREFGRKGRFLSIPQLPASLLKFYT